jgi:hypothetical protein
MRSGSVLGRTAGGTSEIGQAIRRELNWGAPEAFPSERKEIMTRTPFRCAAGVMDLIASRKVAKKPIFTSGADNEAIERRARYGQERGGCQRQDHGRVRFLLQQRHLAKKLARLHFGEHGLMTIVGRSDTCKAV